MIKSVLRRSFFIASATALLSPVPIPLIILRQTDPADPKVQDYLNILEEKAQRLKTLTEDVVEASKVSSGNISLEYMDLDLS